MLGRVLVPVDGTEAAEAVLPAVLALHEATGCEAVLLYITEQGEEPLQPDAYLAAVEDRARLLGIRAVTCTTATGEVAEAIAQAAVDQEASLIAMSPYEELGLIGSLLGSVTEQVIRHTRVPILTVNAEAKVEPTGLLTDILVALDGSDLSLRALPVLRSLGGETPEQRVTLLYVAHPGEGVPDAPASEDETLREARRLLQASGVQVRCAIVPGRDVAKTIIEVATASGAHLIACATHGRSALGKLALGSVADSLLRQSPLPVLIVR